jgi:hypothetical protein
METKGVPTTREGEEAKQSMESRRALATRHRDALIKQIVDNAKVFQGGGAELLQLTLAERVREAANAALVRLFPRFKEADSAAWETVMRRARDGADQLFQPIGHGGPTEQHSVCQQVLSTIGAGKVGGDVRKVLRASPYGWPQDAIDAALIALHRSQHLTATLNGARLALGQLDQNKIAKAEFRVERITLSVGDRIAIRKLFQALSMNCKASEELAKASEFLDKLLNLARATGGEPPLPPAPSTIDIEDIQARAGNDQLAGLRDKAADFTKQIGEWTKIKALVDTRKPIWETVERLACYAAGLPAAEEHLKQVEAVCSQRLLLEPTDPVSPLRGALADALRKALLDTNSAHEKAYATGLATLDASSLWQRLQSTERANILANLSLTAPAAADVSSDGALLAALDARSLSARQAEADAVSGRVQRALEQAARLLEPKVRSIPIERATLMTEADVRQWVERQQQTLLTAIKDGPVLVN